MAFLHVRRVEITNLRQAGRMPYSWGRWEPLMCRWFGNAGARAKAAILARTPQRLRRQVEGVSGF